MCGYAFDTMLWDSSDVTNLNDPTHDFLQPYEDWADHRSPVIALQEAGMARYEANSLDRSEAGRVSGDGVICLAHDIRQKSIPPFYSELHRMQPSSQCREHRLQPARLVFESLDSHPMLTVRLKIAVFRLHTTVFRLHKTILSFRPAVISCHSRNIQMSTKIPARPVDLQCSYY